MKNSNSVEAFWKEFCRTGSGPGPSDPYQAWYFGDSRALADELCDLVLQGKKKATACLVWEAELDPGSAPVLNGYSVVTDFDGNPRCIIRTREIRVVPFDEVDERFAAEEGEGDQSLEFWRRVHWDYFSRKCEEMGKEASPAMAVMCERFEVVYQ
ncbi:MAG TPA: ASCH domain-containing protein [Blastocatellia bacterium]|jgi:uncharacterized protein YhfF|nr:ASCH domain-containing protein [Blastocatellia bacterium]